MSESDVGGAECVGGVPVAPLGGLLGLVGAVVLLVCSGLAACCGLRVGFGAVAGDAECLEVVECVFAAE